MFSILQALPHQCHLCGLTISKNNRNDIHTLWCDECVTLIYQQSRSQHSHWLCSQCGLPMFDDDIISQENACYRGEMTPPNKVTFQEKIVCGQCLRSPPPWDRLFCLGDYKTPVREMIHKLKYQRHYWLAKPLAYLLIPFIADPAFVCVPVPLHWRRQLMRGFNQSELLTKQMVTYWQQQGINIQMLQLFKRSRHTKAQQGLSQDQRQKNLRHAFKLTKKPDDTHIALVDDVVTTGSTLIPLCQQLRRTGVERIDVYCLCRTSLG